jgi:hypothetical protein
MGNLRTLTLGTSRSATFDYSGTLPKLAVVTENGSTRAIEYDEAGNEITAGAIGSSYSPRGHLVSQGGPQYLYDGRGIRTLTQATAYWTRHPHRCANAGARQ